MFIEVKQVIKDSSDETRFIVTTYNLKVSWVDKFRVWHRSAGHRDIEGDFTHVTLYRKDKGKEWFIIINENVNTFRERVNAVKSSSWRTPQKTS